MEANQYYIYLFRVKKTGTVIYVGSCKSIGKRMNEHRRAFRDPSHELPIHRYMKEQGLKLIDDVEVVIVEFLNNTTREKALEVEAQYYFKYKDTVKNTRPAEIRSGVYSSRNKPVRCVNDGKVFISIRKAADYYGVDRSTVMYNLNKGRKLYNGLLFEYVNEKDVVDRKNMIAIKCLDDGKCFQMVSHCAEYYGIPKWKFYDKARTKEGKYTIEGLHFERFND